MHFFIGMQNFLVKEYVCTKKPYCLEDSYQISLQFSDNFFNKQSTQLLTKFLVVSCSEIFRSVHPTTSPLECLKGFMQSKRWTRFSILAPSRCINICLLHSYSPPGRRQSTIDSSRTNESARIVFNNWIIKFTV